MNKFITSFILFVFLSLNLNAQKVKYDPQQMWVTDLENILTDDEEYQLNKIISDYEIKTTVEIAILTTDNYEDFGDISDYAIYL